MTIELTTELKSKFINNLISELTTWPDGQPAKSVHELSILAYKLIGEKDNLKMWPETINRLVGTNNLSDKLSKEAYDYIWITVYRVTKYMTK